MIHALSQPAQSMTERQFKLGRCDNRAGGLKARWAALDGTQDNHVMRVVMLSKALVVGAYQRKCELIAAHDDIELTVFTPTAWAGQPLERANVSGYTLRALPIRFDGNFHLHHYPTLARELAASRPDVLHIDEEPYNLATFLALRAASALRERHEIPVKTLFFTWQNLLRRYPPPFNWMERHVLTHVDGGIAGNQEAAQVCRAKGFAGDMPVIPQFGVDETRFRPVDGRARPAGVFTIGYAGRLVPEKGVDVLLHAVAGLPNNARLSVIGAGPERAALERLSSALGLTGQVTFQPPCPSTEMPQVYAQFDALVLPSRTRTNWKEQFGRVLIEAMACGVPVIGSTCGEIPNVIGDAGLIFAENDAEALRAQLARLIESPSLRENLARRGRERILARYTMRRIADQTVAVYRQFKATGLGNSS
ncbi:MAG: glycosyltransferase [Candidatus Roseilinea sp.]|uniref:glycosyltransferase n=1 Tax=Candidatus Roseilinea sp. TaxID=2838777 RepID=UPI00404B6B57